MGEKPASTGQEKRNFARLDARDLFPFIDLPAEPADNMWTMEESGVIIWLNFRFAVE